jgi:hypothetical protein
MAAMILATALMPACRDQSLPTEAAPPASPRLAIRIETGKDNPGPPYYSPIQPGWFPMTESWAAIPWVRDVDCVPSGFNILGLLDLTILFPPAVPFPGPRPFFCPLTVEGTEIWNTDPPDPAVGPLNVVWNGLGAVPIYFVSAAELVPAMADGVLTIADLEAMSSLRVGRAASFTLTNQLGTARDAPGTGKINITATGVLDGGGAFFFQTAEGPPHKAPIAHTRIELR